MEREDLIQALLDEIGEWDDNPPEYVTVPGRFLEDVLRLLEEDDG
jgi:hypothetical protein